MDSMINVPANSSDFQYILVGDLSKCIANAKIAANTFN